MTFYFSTCLSFGNGATCIRQNALARRCRQVHDPHLSFFHMNMGAVLLFEEEVGVTSAILGELCVAPYMGARAFPADLNSHLTDSRLPSRALEKSIETQVSLGKPARKHHSLLNTKCFGEFTSHQLSLSRVRKIVLKSTTCIVLSRPKKAIHTYRDAKFPARQTPREHQIAA